MNKNSTDYCNIDDVIETLETPEENLAQLQDILEMAPSIEVVRKICFISRSVGINLLSQITSRGAQTTYARKVKKILQQSADLTELVLNQTKKDSDEFNEVSHYLVNIRRRINSIRIMSSRKPILERLELLDAHLA